jgi:hypothetical protein
MPGLVPGIHGVPLTRRSLLNAGFFRTRLMLGAKPRFTAERLDSAVHFRLP